MSVQYVVNLGATPDSRWLRSSPPPPASNRPLITRPFLGGQVTTMASSSSFTPLRSFVSQKPSSSPKFSMRLASGSKQAYICRDCGYIYNDRTPFEKQPDKYFCPVCGAPKRRFRPYQSNVSKDANATDVRKSRKEQIKKDEALGRALPVAIAAGIVLLAGLYFYLNNTF